MSTNGLTLHTLDDVERLARIAITSGLTSLRRPEEAAVILMTGHELGLSPMQALRGIYVVSGRPVLSADLMVAIVRRSGLCDSWRVVESTAERCEIWTLRKGEDTVAKRVWTMADAKRAGVTGKGTWAQYPAAMLRHRCAADLAREVYPDVLLGLYDPDELGGEPATVDAIPATAEPSLSLAPLGIEQAKPAPRFDPSAWLRDLAACGRVRELRAVYASHARDFAEGGASGRDDVRAWLRARGLCASAEDVTAILGTMPETLLAALDLAALDLAAMESTDEPAPKPDADALVIAGRVVRAAEVDAHSQQRAWAVLARSYAEATARPLRDAAEALKAACVQPDPDEPPTGTDGPRSREPGEDDGADDAGFDAARSQQGDARACVASLEAVAERAEEDPRLRAVRDHLATKRARPAIVNSVRAHWSEVLADDAVRDLYAGRLRAITPAVVGDRRHADELDADARALVTQWATEARTAAQEQRAA